MWKPHKSDTETIQIEILGIAELEISKKLVRVEKKLSKNSNELREMDIFQTTPKRRRNKRLILDAECEERDRLQRKLEIIKEWKEEIYN